MHPWLLPPRHLDHSATPQGPSTPQMQQVLHVFWLAVAQDAVRCIAQLLPPQSALQQLQAAAAHPAAAQHATLRAGDAQSAVDASNQLLQLLGRPANMDTAEALYRRLGAVPAAAAGAATEPSAGAQFRPGDFGWKLGERVVGLVSALCQADATSAWALSCFAPFHFLIDGSMPAADPLRAPYMRLRERLKHAAPQAMMQYLLHSAQQQQQQLRQQRPLPPQLAAATTAAAAAAPVAIYDHAVQEQRHPNAAQTAAPCIKLEPGTSLHPQHSIHGFDSQATQALEWSQASAAMPQVKDPLLCTSFPTSALRFAPAPCVPLF